MPFSFCTWHPDPVAFVEILLSILTNVFFFIFEIGSAVGQSFIFYTISNFEPLVCSTVTTTRKIFSVLLSIFVNNHKLDARGWTGIGVACMGIVGELQDKASKQHK
jgi:UDP-galactose transporter B1